MGLIKKIMGEEEDVIAAPTNDQYYDLKAEEALTE